MDDLKRIKAQEFSLLPTPYSLLPKTQDLIPHQIRTPLTIPIKKSVKLWLTPILDRILLCKPPQVQRSSNLDTVDQLIHSSVVSGQRSVVSSQWSAVSL
ncbi:MAG: hypothetical protein F6J94_05970 [Moorea sp. SIO1F2]|uniref:hypothetical protein n=1 Tax=Moorena sp. SIO1F2 TaxID=2607819 RepID=UPI0013BCBDDC|nr:hypothetical protein [Moorena sp. SIO1F2]NET81515.1 hypothetical protein [Moorena sp. SIO1F2]